MYPKLFAFLFIVNLFFISSAQDSVIEVTDVHYQFNTEKIDTLNSEYSEMAPVYFDHKFIFSSMREHDYLYTGENRWRRKKQYNLFEAQLDTSSGFDVNQFNDIKFYNDQINKQLHTGPISFSSTGDTLFITQVVKTKYRKKKTYRPLLYVAFRKDNGEFSKPEKLPFVNERFNFAHPTFDSKRRKLYFSSDKEGTLGGEDIFFAEWKDDGTWSKVKNLGDSINSEKDEMFPWIYRGNELFFASDRDGGEGGLDLYWSFRDKNSWGKTRNLGSSLNSEADDFSLSLHPSEKYCFFASDRSNNDDIYYATFKRFLSTTQTDSLLSKVEMNALNRDTSGLNAASSEEGSISMDASSKDESDRYNLNKLKGDKNQLKENSSEDGSIQMDEQPNNDSKSAFTFKKDQKKLGLNQLRIGKNNSIFDTDKDSIDLDAQFIFNETSGEFPADMEVNVVNKKDELIRSTRTDMKGKFSYNNLPKEDSLYLTLSRPVNRDMTLIIFKNETKVTALLRRVGDTTSRGEKMQRDFVDNLKLQNPEENNQKELKGEIDFKKMDGFFENGLNLTAYDQNNIKLSDSKSNETGTFTFDSLSEDFEVLKFKIHNADSYQNDDLFFFITNEQGEKIARLEKNKNGYYVYRPMGAEPLVAAEITFESETTYESEVDDENEGQYESQEQEEKKIAEGKIESKTIYFDLNSSYFNERNKENMKKVSDWLKQTDANIEVSSYADSRATVKYNMWLSARRSKRVVNYLVQHGVSSSRISSNHYGESRLVNDCGDDVDCPETEHQKNRRTEIILAQ